MPTSNPSAARSSAVALPMPESAPVTIARRSCAGVVMTAEYPFLQHVYRSGGAVVWFTERRSARWASRPRRGRRSADAEGLPDRVDREVDDEQPGHEPHEGGDLA